MIEEFIYYFLICWGFYVVAYKYSIKQKLNSLSQKWKSRFIYDLSECEFCIEHHISLILLIFVIMKTEEYHFLHIVYPFMAASLSNIIKTLRA